ncbi:MAG: tetratricopeptide repeat protein [Deltaproteobacteria bacterium]|nr:tetratricopeptide repeat protein [Deltaproteobacteria bacterium]
MHVKVLISSLAVLAVLVIPLAASSQDNEENARVQFEQGKTFFNEGKYEQAAIALERAYELRPGFKILYYLGLAEGEQGNYSRALMAYTRYLLEGADKDDPKRVDEVRVEMERLSSMVGRIHIECSVDGAKVKLDDETQGVTPLDGPVFANVGRHDVLVKKGQEVLLKEAIRIAGGQEITLKVEVTSSPPSEPPSHPPAPKEDQPRRRVWTWVAFGIGGAAGIGAVITGVLALKKDDKMWSQCGDDGTCFSYEYDGDFTNDRDALEALGLTTDILIGVAAAGVIAGTILYFVEPGGKKEKDESVAVLPSAFGSGAGLSVTGRF